MSTTPAATATLEQAREHARAQSGTKARTKPTIPASTAAGVSDGSGGPDGIRAETIRWDETIGTGNYASKLLRRGTMVRFTDTDGDACIAMVVFNAEATQERINVADTVKVQWQAYLGAGALLLSDMGRVLMTIVDDSSERHDALCGYTNRRENEHRYGAGGVSSATPAARELLALAAAKHGLARRDLPSGVNLFKGVHFIIRLRLALSLFAFPFIHQCNAEVGSTNPMSPKWSVL